MRISLKQLISICHAFLVMLTVFLIGDSPYCGHARQQLASRKSDLASEGFCLTFFVAPSKLSHCVAVCIHQGVIVCWCVSNKVAIGRYLQVSSQPRMRIKRRAKSCKAVQH
jgi:hypothetical protein